MRAAFIAASAAALLVACDGGAGPSSGPTSAAVGGPAWRFEASGAGAALVYGAAGAETLRFGCRKGQRGPEIFAVAPGVATVGSEDRATLGVGGELATLVADLRAGGPGLVAAGETSDLFLAALQGGGEVALAYGAQTVGPLPGPGMSEAARLAASCRAL